MKRSSPSSAGNPRMGPTRDRWLLSYADFLTLLLALFVVLYASARVDAEKQRGLFEGLASGFTAETPPDEPAESGESRDILVPIDAEAAQERLESRLVARIERERERTQIDSGISIHPSERGLVISLAAAEYFPAGGAEIPVDRRRFLAAIAPLLAAERGALHFEGHTDDRPVAKALFPSNWELSSARAAAVARYFMDEHAIAADRVTVTGHAAVRPLSLADTPSERARNRRVEIVVHADAELARPQAEGDPERELGRLLEALPPLVGGPDDTLRPPPPGPPPPDIPLP